MRNLGGKLAGSGAALVAAVAGANAFAQTPYNWTGFYVGMHGDYSWGNSHAEQAGKLKTHGAGAGLQAGYNWQLSSVVIGAEIDGTLSGQNSKADPFFDGKNATLKARERWSGTARLKVGLPLGGAPVVDNMLLYGTGGMAYAHWKTVLQEIDIGGNAQQSDAQNHLGWVAGAGVEAPLGSGLSAKLEYLRIQYGKRKYDLTTGSGDKLGIDHDVNTVRLGLNLRF